MSLRPVGFLEVISWGAGLLVVILSVNTKQQRPWGTQNSMRMNYVTGDISRVPQVGLPPRAPEPSWIILEQKVRINSGVLKSCLLYTSDAADDIALV